MNKTLAASIVGAAALALASPSYAEDVVCGYAPAGWNAPNGAVVFNKAAGSVDAVLSAVGEYRSHSMLSHGPGGGVSHATMKTPDQNGWPLVCGLPLNADQLRNGYPGLEQINQGGIYSFLFGQMDPARRTQWMGWQRWDPPRAEAIANALWWNYSIFFDASRVDTTQAIDRPARHGARVNYSLFQFRELEQVHQIPSHSANNGMVCSTFLAYAHNYAGQGQLSPYTYSHAGLANAANALHAGVNADCRNSLGFWGSLGLTFACPFFDVCYNAASQVANCMATNSCDRSEDYIWKGVRDDPASTARSISPDRLGGWGVHWATRDPSNVWAPDYTHPVQWNSGGSVYGCWN